MSNQVNNGIQQNFTTEKPLEHLPTETNASEQVFQELNAEQLEGVTGGIGTGFARNVVVDRLKMHYGAENVKVKTSWFGCVPYISIRERPRTNTQPKKSGINTQGSAVTPIQQKG